MLLAFHLFIIVIANFTQFTTQAPYQGSDVQQDYKRLHNEKPLHLRQEFYYLDGSVPEDFSNRMILRSRQEENTPGKKKLSQVHVSVNGQTVFHRDTNKDGDASVDVDVNNIYEPPVRDYINSNYREVYQDEYGKRYYRIENEYVNVDGILRPVYEDINGKRFYRPVRKITSDNPWFSFTDIYGNTHYTQSYHVRVSTRTTKQYPKYQTRPARQTTSREREHRPSKHQTNDRGLRPIKQHTHDDPGYRPTRASNDRGPRPTKQSSYDRRSRPTKQHFYEVKGTRPTKKYYDLQPLKHNISSYQKQKNNRNSGEKDFGALLPHEFHFKH